MPNRVAIVGIGQTRHRSTRLDVTLPEMINEAVRAALADAELSIKEIEAVFTSNMETFEGIYLPDHGAAAEIGAYMKPGFKVCTGGTSGASVVVEGFCMVASGLHDVAWWWASRSRTAARRRLPSRPPPRRSGARAR